MIFGKLDSDKHREEQDKIIRQINGVREFAWFPTQLRNGHWVWLEHYWAYYHGGNHPNGDFFIWSGSSDTYCPMADRYTNPSSQSRVPLNNGTSRG